MRTGPAVTLTKAERRRRRRYLPYVGSVVTVRWGSHPVKNETRTGRVISAGPFSLWLIAHEDGNKIEHDLFVKYTHIKQIEETHG